MIRAHEDSQTKDGQKNADFNRQLKDASVNHCKEHIQVQDASTIYEGLEYSEFITPEKAQFYLTKNFEIT